MEDTNIIEEMPTEQKVMNAVKLIANSAEFMSSAGFTKTAEQLLHFALEVATLMEKEMAMIEQFNNKLTNNEFDEILANILNVEIEVPNV
jgi:hypothetical protein